MDTLPPEVYSQIVALIRPKHYLRHVLPIEITLSHVSSSWRFLALCDSKSWEVIEVFSPKTLPRGMAYAERSADSAVYLRVDLYDYEVGLMKKVKRVRARRQSEEHKNSTRTKDEQPEVEHRRFILALTDLLTKVGHRCKSILVLTYREGTARELVQAFQDLEAPLLQSFRIDVNEAADEDEELAEETEGAAGPEARAEEAKPLLPLKIFTQGVESLHTLWLETPVFPPLSHLTTLYLFTATPDWLSFNDFKTIAAEAVHLQNLSLSSKSALGYSRHSLWPYHGDAPAVHMPALRALKLADEYPGITVKALLTIDAPGLVSLWVRATAATMRSFFDAPQITRASASGEGKFPKLEYLTLDFFDMTETPLFASTFPTITHLRLSYFLAFLSVRFGNDMGVKPDGTFWWPKLEKLVLEIQKGGRGSVLMARMREAVCRVVNARSGFGDGEGTGGVRVPRILGDRDVCEALRASDMLNEMGAVEEINMCLGEGGGEGNEVDGQGKGKYEEPWWLLSQQRTMDRIGLL